MLVVEVTARACGLMTLAAVKSTVTAAGAVAGSAIYGHGLMQGMNLGGTYGADLTKSSNGTYTEGASRWRFVEEFVLQPVKSFATSFATIYETWNPAITSQDSGHWFTVGARPTYYFSDHFSTMLELGMGNVKLAGTNVHSNNLYRVTLAPQITPKAEFFARPSLRAFITRTMAPQSSDANSFTETSYGFQGEVWF